MKLHCGHAWQHTQLHKYIVTLWGTTHSHEYIAYLALTKHKKAKCNISEYTFFCRLLPQKNKNETGVRVYIQDFPDYHRGPCMDSSGKCSVNWCTLRSKCVNLITPILVDQLIIWIITSRTLNSLAHSLTVYLIIMLLQKCPKLVPFHSGTSGDKEYQGKKEINVALHTLNQRSRDNPKVNGHEMYCWQLQWEENIYTFCIHIFYCICGLYCLHITRKTPVLIFSWWMFLSWGVLQVLCGASRSTLLTPLVLVIQKGALPSLLRNLSWRVLHTYMSSTTTTLKMRRIPMLSRECMKKMKVTASYPYMCRLLYSYSLVNIHGAWWWEWISLYDVPLKSCKMDSSWKLVLWTQLYSEKRMFWWNFFRAEIQSKWLVSCVLFFFLIELLESKRLTIAVTQYDKFFESSNDESYGDEISNFSDEVETHDVKRRICQQVQDTLGLTSPVLQDLINLASGMWALKARKLTPNEKNLSALRQCLEVYLKKASLGEKAASCDVAERLLAASGIGVLEKK